MQFAPSQLQVGTERENPPHTRLLVNFSTVSVPQISSCREIPISLSDNQKGETKAQACVKACLQQLSFSRGDCGVGSPRRHRYSITSSSTGRTNGRDVRNIPNSSPELSWR